MSSLKIIVLSIYFLIRKFGTKSGRKHCEHLSGHPFTGLNISNGFFSPFLLQERGISERSEREREGADGRERERTSRTWQKSQGIDPPSPFFIQSFFMYFLNSFFFLLFFQSCRISKGFIFWEFKQSWAVQQKIPPVFPMRSRRRSRRRRKSEELFIFSLLLLE